MRKEKKNIFLLQIISKGVFDMDFYRNTNSKFELDIYKISRPLFITMVKEIPDIIVIIYDSNTINDWIESLELKKDYSKYKNKRLIFVIGADQINKTVKDKAAEINAEIFDQSLEKLYEKLAETETKEVIETAEINEIVVKKNNIFKILFLILTLLCILFFIRKF